MGRSPATRQAGSRINPDGSRIVPHVCHRSVHPLQEWLQPNNAPRLLNPDSSVVQAKPSVDGHLDSVHFDHLEMDVIPRARPLPASPRGSPRLLCTRLQSAHGEANMRVSIGLSAIGVAALVLSSARPPRLSA